MNAIICIRDLDSPPHPHSFYLLVFSFTSNLPTLIHFSPLLSLPLPHKVSSPPTRTIAVANLVPSLGGSRYSSRQRDLSKNSDLSPSLPCLQPTSQWFPVHLGTKSVTLLWSPRSWWSGPSHCFSLTDARISLTLCPPATKNLPSNSPLQDSCTCHYHCSEDSSPMPRSTPVTHDWYPHSLLCPEAPA